MSEERARAQSILEYLAGQRDAMVEMLVSLVEKESPTDVVASQAAVQSQLSDALCELGFGVRHVPGRETGGHLFAVPEHRERGKPAQLLIGHSDTVWPLGTLETMPVVVENGHVRGPGTFDMKAGIVQGIFALRALRELGHQPPATPVWFINSDEETGSPESTRYVRLIAKHVARAFVLEPALGLVGHLKTARKGVGRFVVRVHGKAAHSGLDPTGGASAIHELMHVVQRLHAITDLERGVTVNVGVVRGGSRVNVIAAEAEAEVDVRILSASDGEAIAETIHAMRALTPGTSLEIEGGIQIPPLERTARNRLLWQAAAEAGGRLGMDLTEDISGGGSDGNTTSLYTATLDGLGPRGDGAHANHEHVEIESLVDRAALVAELLMSPVESG
ncbi:MAG TPA: carboxypeptidase [Gemmatimonadetes bacterium]|nr:carboxypeptidase [Gemmatimonadota bacterium]HBD99135.1 carboxypeptidase [Gemmatimonadota bacterium]HIN51881.1 M20 family peptidase [Gemmatimonadota bacterium]